MTLSRFDEDALQEVPIKRLNVKQVLAVFVLSLRSDRSYVWEVQVRKMSNLSVPKAVDGTNGLFWKLLTKVYGISIHTMLMYLLSAANKIALPQDDIRNCLGWPSTLESPASSIHCNRFSANQENLETQLLNFFNIDDKLRFVDVPGGYAVFPKRAWKMGWMIEEYLMVVKISERLSKCTFDLRHDPSAGDVQMYEFLAQPWHSGCSSSDQSRYPRGKWNSTGQLLRKTGLWQKWWFHSFFPQSPRMA